VKIIINFPSLSKVNPLSRFPQGGKATIAPSPRGRLGRGYYNKKKRVTVAR